MGLFVPVLGFCFPFAGLKAYTLMSFFTSLWMCLLECVTSLLPQQHTVCSHGNYCDVISKGISVPRQPRVWTQSDRTEKGRGQWDKIGVIYWKLVKEREVDDGRDLVSYFGRHPIYFTDVWSNMSLLLLIMIAYAAVAEAIQIPILGSLFHVKHFFVLQRQWGAKCRLNKSVQIHLGQTCILCVHCNDGKNSAKGSLLKSCIKISCIAGNGKRGDKRKHTCALSYPALSRERFESRKLLWMLQNGWRIPPPPAPPRHRGLAYKVGRFLFPRSVWSQTVHRCPASLVGVRDLRWHSWWCAWQELRPSAKTLPLVSQN